MSIIPRFNVWLSSSPTSDFKLTDRLFVIGFSTRVKGTGAANFKMVRKATASNIRTGSEFFSDEIKTGLFVKITYDIDPATPPSVDTVDSVLWHGYILSVVNEVPNDGSSNDSMGTVMANELGYFMYTTLLDKPFDEYGNQLSVFPVYNPVADDFIYGNNFGDNKFTAYTSQRQKISHGIDDTFETMKDSFWNRRQVLQNLCSRTILSIDLDYDDKEHPFFQETVLESFPAFQNQSLGEALDFLISEPFNWQSVYNISTASFTIKITTDAVEPVGDSLAGTLVSPTLADISDLTIIDFQPAFDKVTYRGNRILIGGTLTTMRTTGGQPSTLTRGWQVEDKNKMRDLPYVPGDGDEQALEGEKERLQAIRQKSFPDVYTKFVSPFLDEEVKWRINALPGDRATTTDTRNFFVKFEFEDSEGNPLPVPLYDPFSEDHAEPNEFNFIWEEYLPIVPSNFSVLQTSLGEAEQLVGAFAAFYGAFRKNFGWNPVLNTQVVGIMEASLDFLKDGFVIKLPYPEMLGGAPYVDLFTDSSGLIMAPSVEGWDETKLSEKNPVRARGAGHWERLVLSLAARSDQYLEWTETRKYITGFNPGGDPNYAPVPPYRVAVIDDPSLELWFIHINTALGVDSSESFVDGDIRRSRLLRQDEDQITRNDFDIVLKRCKEYSSWLFTERNGVQISYPISKIQEIQDWAILGNIVNKVNYPNNSQNAEYNINTAIKSIEYFVEGGNPRIVISTQIPDLPLIQKVVDASRPDSTQQLLNVRLNEFELRQEQIRMSRNAK